MADASAALARFAATTSLAQVPAAVQQRLKECLLDFIGNAAFAAVFVESSSAFSAGAQALGYAPGDSTVVGEPGGHAPMVAALLNGAYCHTLDFDDTNVWGTLHPGAPVIAAALAEAERVHASGAQLLAAIAVGYEVACRVGAALGQTAYDRGFHITGVAGLFGAAAAAGRLRGADADTLEQAFGLAGSKAAASMQYLDSGTWNKRLHPGFAAHDALMVLSFARAGVLAAQAPLEGRYGLLTGYSNAPRPEALTDRLGSWWPSGDTAIKPYPSCRLTHGAIEATLALRDKVGAPGAGPQPLRVRLSTKAMQIVGEPLAHKIRPQTLVDAQFSVYFQVAVAWREGCSTWQGYERLSDPEVRAQCEAIEVVVDPDVTVTGAVVTLGQHSVRIDELLGEPARPFDGERLREKFDGLAVPVYGAEQSAEIARRVAALQDEADVAGLIRRLRRENTK